MSSEQEKIVPFSEIRDTSRGITQVAPQEALKRSYEFVVIIPYSSNLFDHGPKKGEPHLSLFSALPTIAAANLYERGAIDNILLCGKNTFRDQQISTTDLTVRKLQEVGIPIRAIRAVSANNLDNTAFQIEALAARQKMSGRQKPYLLVPWQFHERRVMTHAKAYGLRADTVSVEDTLSYFFPKFNRGKYRGILDAFVRREQVLIRLLSVDSKGRIPRLITRFRGASVNDVVVVTDDKGNRKLELLDTTGKKRMAEVNS